MGVEAVVHVVRSVCTMCVCRGGGGGGGVQSLSGCGLEISWIR